MYSRGRRYDGGGVWVVRRCTSGSGRGCKPARSGSCRAPARWRRRGRASVRRPLPPPPPPSAPARAPSARPAVTRASLSTCLSPALSFYFEPRAPVLFPLFVRFGAEGLAAASRRFYSLDLFELIFFLIKLNQGNCKLWEGSLI